MSRVVGVITPAKVDDLAVEHAEPGQQFVMSVTPRAWEELRGCFFNAPPSQLRDSLVIGRREMGWYAAGREIVVVCEAPAKVHTFEWSTA